MEYLMVLVYQFELVMKLLMMLMFLFQKKLLMMLV